MSTDNFSFSSNIGQDESAGASLKKIILRYLAFWPHTLISILFFVSAGYLYNRYAKDIYKTTAVIEIIDKAQDSEMALPTSMTVFNRSMINLENEYGRISSYDLNKSIVSKLKSNIRYYEIGSIIDSEIHKDDLFEDYNIEFKIDTDKINKESKYSLTILDDNLNISYYDKKKEVLIEENFKGLNSFTKEHAFPFNIKINSVEDGLKKGEEIIKEIHFTSFDKTVQRFISLVNTSQFSNSSSSLGSDQIELSIKYHQRDIAEEYLQVLINDFDYDGILERQLEYKRTVDFIEERSKILENEVTSIEKIKEEFKKNNKISDLSNDANISLSKKVEYDTNLFNLQAEYELLQNIKLSLKEDFNSIPINLGINNAELNQLFLRYNELIKNRNEALVSGAGKNNQIVFNIESQIKNLFSNINESLESYDNSLLIRISQLKSKESEFDIFYTNIPEKERILREIDRELAVKEALYSLLLQKKEEALINNAVVKPTIKIIDSARSSQSPVEPNKPFIFLTFALSGFLLPNIILTIIFYLDTKVHVKDDIESLGIPIVGEIPYIKDFKFNDIDTISSSERNTTVESIRMVIANIKHSFFDSPSKNQAKVILVTSSIKGEGKTLISVNLSKILSFSNKVLLIGADLRNPQIHKYTRFEKSEKGLSDILFSEKLSNPKDFIKKSDNLDFLLSGTIPPNPTELLSSTKFRNLIENFKNDYEYIIIDSAPCILVADTLQFGDIANTSIIAVRSNHTEKNVLSFIKELKAENKLNKIQLVLNGVGNSRSYGYKYGYQYGYKYGYKYGYSYNYGYGYGYGSEKEG